MPSSEKYHLTEPHASIPKSLFLHSGRGGAGNVTFVDSKSLTAGPDTIGPASAAKLNSQPPKNPYAAGRGGAGNFYRDRERERAIFSFDEELERQRKLTENQAPVYHIGRGGAGNLIDENAEQNLGRSSRTFSTSSASSSDGSVRRSVEGTLNKLRTSFGRH